MSKKLLLAVKNGDKKQFLTLFNEKSKFDINIQDENGWTPLMFATLNNDINCAQILINAGARLDIVNQDFDTAWHIAERFNIFGVKEILESVLNKKQNKDRPYYEYAPLPKSKL